MIPISIDTLACKSYREKNIFYVIFLKHPDNNNNFMIYQPMIKIKKFTII